MNVRPLHDRLIVQRLEESAQRAGAIIIPDSAKEKPQEADPIMSNQITYGDLSRQAILRGVNSLANAVKVTLGPGGATSSSSRRNSGRHFTDS